MIIIGEKINGSILIVAEAIAKRDSEFILKKEQSSGGKRSYLY